MIDKYLNIQSKIFKIETKKQFIARDFKISNTKLKKSILINIISVKIEFLTLEKFSISNSEIDSLLFEVTPF